MPVGSTDLQTASNRSLPPRIPFDATLERGRGTLGCEGYDQVLRGGDYLVPVRSSSLVARLESIRRDTSHERRETGAIRELDSCATRPAGQAPWRRRC